MADSQLQKNTNRLKDFDKRIQDLSSVTDSIKNKVDGEIEEITNLKTDIVGLKNESQQKLSESNELIKEKIRQQFQSELEDGESRIKENNEACEELQKEIDDLYRKIADYDNEANNKIKIYRTKKKEYDDLLHQYNLLKESCADAEGENHRLKRMLEQRKVKTSTLDAEIEELKLVIAKLTDARVILNRYFSIHYENFTEEEKKLISEIEGNVFPGYYNNNPVIPETKPVEIPVENPNKIDPNLVSSLTKNTASVNKGTTGKILSAEEYEAYQDQLKQNASPQISNVGQSQRYNRSYVGPDDDYWYEKKK